MSQPASEVSASAQMSQPAQHVRRDLSWCIDISDAALMSQPAPVKSLLRRCCPSRPNTRRDLSLCGAVRKKINNTIKIRALRWRLLDGARCQFPR